MQTYSEFRRKTAIDFANTSGARATRHRCRRKGYGKRNGTNSPRDVIHVGKVPRVNTSGDRHRSIYPETGVNFGALEMVCVEIAQRGLTYPCETPARRPIARTRQSHR